jgi:hypothetical protein
VWLRLQKISAERAPSLRTFLANAGGREVLYSLHMFFNIFFFLLNLIFFSSKFNLYVLTASD